MANFRAHRWITNPSIYFFLAGTISLFQNGIRDRSTIFSVFALYWVESLVMGIFTSLKMKRAKKSEINRTSDKYPLLSFTILLFGFLLLHGVGLGMIAGIAYRSNALVFTLSRPLVWGFFAILAGHLIDYIQFVYRREYESITPSEAKGWVFLRIIVFHLSIAIGLPVLWPLTHSLLAIFLLFMSLKIIAELLIFLGSQIRTSQPD